MVASLLETILITNVVYGSRDLPPLPKWLKILVLKYLARLACMKKSCDKHFEANTSECTFYKNTMTDIPKTELVGASPVRVWEQCLDEMKKMSTDLLAIRHQVEEHFISCLVNMLRCEEGQSGPTYDSLQEVIDKKSFRPSVNLSTPTITNISFTLYAILGVNEKAQILTTFLWLRLYWFHEFLIWDPDACDSITKISLPVKDLWTPDIIVYEFVDDDVSQACPYVYVNHTGHIRYDRMLRLVSACNLQIFSFPFDIQNCSFTFGSYMHTIKDVRVSPALSFKEMTENSKRYLQASGEWELVFISGDADILKFGIDEWDIITFWVVIKRRPILYVVNLIIPSSFLMIIDILSFYLPPHSVDRSSFKMTLILGYTVFLLIMNDLLPSTANGTPLIGIYFSVCLAFMTISLLETVLITCVLHHNSMKYREVPHWVQVLVMRFIARIICYSFPEDPLAKLEGKQETNPWVVQPSESTSSQQTSTNASGSMTLDVPELRQISQDLREMNIYLSILRKEDHLQNQWCHVGYILDFLLFRIYLLIITGYALVIICMWCIWMNQ
ncbi:5-hydroxytryptamine receptor 3A isoform X2 [Onychostoma macrolepis]|nr:5-hydroxytryptamine receptor 3A isoform X2 [Onychostoma macrolepis]XP_058617017.1 5-hydroxytryptamine receptor 3A isoform X2 [Onychostoma macrolepis]